jgi:TonB family protein
MTQPDPELRPEMFSSGRRAERSPWAAALSLAAHVALVSLIATLAYREVVMPMAERKRLQFVRVEAPPVVPVELLMPPLPPPEPPKPKLELPPLEPKPEAAPVIIEPVKAPEPIAPRKPDPPPPPKPEVQVGVFASAPRAMATQPPRQVQSTAFDAPAAVAPDMKLKATATGAFDAGSMAARPGTDKPKGVITGTGFDSQATATTPSTGRALAVTGGGFDSRPATTTAARPQSVQASGFGDVRPAETAAAVKTPVPTTPVEVLFKPTPAYTDEARARGIQGDVVLEVEFSSAGTLRVIRVVRGLGHGLDELAVQAAGQIKFKPALENGRPVDVKANVFIVFRLS